MSYPVKCPNCHKVIEYSHLWTSMSAKSCSTCKIRFDVKVDSQSSKTGKYSITNKRPM